MSQQVSFKIPFDEVRGKLAEKQQNVRYQSQPEGASSYYVESGKKLSTNYNKYLVSYRRNGVNRFYVKRQVAINLTDAQRRVQAYITLTNIVANKLLVTVPAITRLTAMFRVGEKRKSENDTLRDYTFRLVSEAVRNGESNIVLMDVNKETYAEMTFTVGQNPLITGNNSLGDTDLLPTMGFTMGEMRKIYQYNRAFSPKVANINVEGREYLFYVVGDVTSIGDLNGNIAGAAFDMEIEAQEVFTRIINNKTGKLVDGGRRYQLYEDADYTTAVGDQLAFAEGMTLYAKEV